jgi:hypothetical protein
VIAVVLVGAALGVWFLVRQARKGSRAAPIVQVEPRVRLRMRGARKGERL